VVSSLIFGAILGATSSAVVIPLLPQLRLREESRTILSIESAFSDVISIVVVLTLLKIATSPDVNFVSLTETFFLSVLLALCIGLLAALGWAVIRKRFQIFDSLFSTPAFMFIIYGLLEISGLSGAIGVLVFGITLGNMDYFKPRVFTENFNTYILNRKDFDPGEIELNSTERFFFAEIVFLFKTFFFIYIGISMQFLGTPAVMAGILLTLLLFLLRVPVIWASIPKNTPKWDAGIMAIMVPKGLAAAVLASLPLQAGITGGEFIRDTTFAVIFFSITVNAALIFLIDRTPVKRIYYLFFTEYGREKNILNGKPEPK
jgi:cell volume regulation protein A